MVANRERLSIFTESSENDKGGHRDITFATWWILEFQFVRLKNSGLSDTITMFGREANAFLSLTRTHDNFFLPQTNWRNDVFGVSD